MKTYVKGSITILALLLAASMPFNIYAAESEAPASDSSETTTAKKEDAPAPLFQMHYKYRVDSFKDQNLVYQNVILLGDSITEGFDVTKYLPGRRVLNRGIGGDVIGNNLVEADKRGLLKRLDESVFNCSPTDVFILIGINDMGQGHTPDVVEAGYRKMLEQIREQLPKVNLHLESVLPTSGRYAHHNKNILDVNERIQKLAGEFNCDYIDLHSLFTDEKGELKAEYTGEGLHLLPPAYKVWSKVIEEKMGW